MRLKILFIVYVFSNYLFGQNFYFKRQSAIDTAKALLGPNSLDYKFIKTKDNELIITYNYWPTEITFNIRYIKIDTSGVVKMKMTGKSDKLYEVYNGNFIGANTDLFSPFSCADGRVVNYYDSALNLKWKKCIQSSNPVSKILTKDAFNFVGSVNSKSHFRCLIYDYTSPQINNVFVSGIVDSTGVTSIKNEPFIYTSDSLSNDLVNYRVNSILIGNYNSQTYFFNYGNNESFANGPVNSFAYISSYDSVANKYNFIDFKIDSLWAINDILRISNNSLLVYGSRAYKPYMFKMDFNGTIYWAKKVNTTFPEISPMSFLEAKILSGNKLVVNYGYNSFSDIVTRSTLVMDTLGSVISSGEIGSGDDRGNFHVINNKVYSARNVCLSRIQILKNSMQDEFCFFNGLSVANPVPDKTPLVNPFQMVSTTNYSLITTDLPLDAFYENTDTLIKMLGCASPCSPQSVSELYFDDQILKIYPNPCDNFINIELKMPFNLKLYSTEGKKILELIDVHTKEIDMSKFQNGIYFLMIDSQGKVFREKIIKNDNK